ncbi:MAG: hypothetical protein OXC06_14150 [Acidimicrobiaceae bacterium]|nr:hypothetical protein [Acidimicrobiaceae bacterium]
MIEGTESKRAGSEAAALRTDGSTSARQRLGTPPCAGGISDGSTGARQQPQSRREAWKELVEFVGRFRGYPLTEWLLQTRQADAAARSAAYARLQGDD